MMKQKGFNLIELLIALAIMGILMTVAVPSLNEYFDESNQRASRDSLISAINVAKREALTKKKPTYLCPTTDGDKCSNKWEKGYGWLVYVDSNRDDTKDNDEFVPVSLKNGLSVNLEADHMQLEFSPNGLTTATNFTFCSNLTDGYDERIEITRLGRVRFTGTSKTYCAQESTE